VLPAVGEVLLETVLGTLSLVGNVLKCLVPFWWLACRENIQAVKDFVGALIDDPLGVAAAIWDGITQPIKADWNNGDYGEAIGRGFATIADAVVGTKGGQGALCGERRGPPACRSGGACLQLRREHPRTDGRR
jgi:hypothetical protein